MSLPPGEKSLPENEDDSEEAGLRDGKWKLPDVIVRLLDPAMPEAKVALDFLVPLVPMFLLSFFGGGGRGPYVCNQRNPSLEIQA